MSISGIEGAGFTPYVAPQIGVPTGVAQVNGTSGVDNSFSDMVLDGIDRLEAVQDKADTLAVRAASGDLENIHDYTIAASEAQVTTQLTVALRNKAVEAFTEIMRMQV